MPDRPYKIMLVESDPPTIEMLVSSLTQRLPAQITCVTEASSCLDTEMIEPHDLVIVDLEDRDDLRVVEHLCVLGPRPVILLADRPSFHDVVTALRLGVQDFFKKPFPVEQLLDSAEGCLRDFDKARGHLQKYRKMRDLVRRVIRERRDLARRVEVICRDLVQAQRHLLHRVVKYQNSQSGNSVV
jgi:DNA-binding response OmpR family regulator